MFMRFNHRTVIFSPSAFCSVSSLCLLFVFKLWGYIWIIFFLITTRNSSRMCYLQGTRKHFQNTYWEWHYWAKDSVSIQHTWRIIWKISLVSFSIVSLLILASVVLCWSITVGFLLVFLRWTKQLKFYYAWWRFNGRNSL